jgi:hypothetical protein
MLSSKARPDHRQQHNWLAAGAVALGVGAALASGSGLAHADTTVTVQQICAEDGANLVPLTVVAASELSFGDPAYWNSTGTVPGLFIAAPPSISRVMARMYEGSFSIDPSNPWAGLGDPCGFPTRAQTRASAADRLR